MLMFVLLTVLFILISYIYTRWIQLKQYWAKRNVPHLPPHPLLGSMTFLMKENASFWFRRMYSYFNEPYIGIWVFWKPAVLVHSTEIARNILIKDQTNFRNRYASSGNTDPAGRLNLFTLDDPLWSIIRRRLSVLFTSSKLRGLQNLITEKTRHLTLRLDNEMQNPNPINLKRVITDYTTDIVGTSSFGVASDATLTGKSSLRSITEDFTTFGIYRGLAWCSVFFIPQLVDYFRFKMFPTERIREMLRTVIALRGGFENKVTEPKDLLDILIKMKQESEDELDMTENLMIAQAAVFVQGGFESTAGALTLGLMELAFCPEEQNKLYEELQQAKGIHGDSLLDGNVLSQLTYLNCVISAVTLRKYPPMGWLDRVALNDYQIDDRLTIKAGTPVYVNTIGMHYDPDYYPEPEKFNPERFNPKNEVNIKPFTYLPFGDGPRNCIGQRLAISILRHAFTFVILNYKLVPLPTTPKPSEMKIDKKTVFITPGEILSLNFVSRK